MAPRVVHWLIVPIAVVIAIATALSITALRDQADDARLTQAGVSDLRAELSAESALEWEARATGMVSTEISNKRGG